MFDGELADALRETAQLLPLDYVGIDCAIDRDGKLLIFEADNALIIHLLDDPALFGYKHAYVPRILTALDAMVRRRIASARVNGDIARSRGLGGVSRDCSTRRSTASSTISRTCAKDRRGDRSRTR